MEKETNKNIKNEIEELFEHYRFEIDPNQTPLRIDKFLMERIANVTRNKIQQALKEGFVKVNNQAVKSNYKVRSQDLITIALPEPPRDDEVLPEEIPLNIVFEDESLVVINKPAGMVVHPAYQNWTGTLLNALVYHFENLPENSSGRPGLVHRIDKDTSGLLVVAKTEEAMAYLAKQFAKHTIQRTYWALVWGIPKEIEGTIQTNLARSLSDRRVVANYEFQGDVGKQAITHYKVLKDLRYVSLVQCNLETGRTHQIRAHFQHLKHPLFNDVTYGGDKILKGAVFSKYRSFIENCFKILPRQALHAKSLGFKHPKTGEEMYFESELSDDFKNCLEKWEHYLKYN